MRTFVCEGFGVFIVVQGRNPYLDPKVLSLQERTSLICVSSGNPFLIGVYLIRGKRGAQDISLYTHAWRPSKATSGSSASPTTSSGSSALRTPSSGSSASPTPSSRSSTYSLQLTVFSSLSSAYYLQLTVFSLLSPAYCLQLTVPKMQPSGMG